MTLRNAHGPKTSFDSKLPPSTLSLVHSPERISLLEAVSRKAVCGPQTGSFISSRRRKSGNEAG